MALDKHKACRLVVRKTHWCRNVAVGLAMDLTLKKYSGRLAEYEVDVPFNVAVVVKLSAILCVESVLPTEKPTMFEDQAGQLRRELRPLASRYQTNFQTLCFQHENHDRLHRMRKLLKWNRRSLLESLNVRIVLAGSVPIIEMKGLFAGIRICSL